MLYENRKGKSGIYSPDLEVLLKNPTCRLKILNRKFNSRYFMLYYMHCSLTIFKRNLELSQQMFIFYSMCPTCMIDFQNFNFTPANCRQLFSVWWALCRLLKLRFEYLYIKLETFNSKIEFAPFSNHLWRAKQKFESEKNIRTRKNFSNLLTQLQGPAQKAVSADPAMQ